MKNGVIDFPLMDEHEESSDLSGGNTTYNVVQQTAEISDKVLKWRRLSKKARIHKMPLYIQKKVLDKAKEHLKLKEKKYNKTITMTQEYITILKKLAKDLKIPQGEVVEKLLKDHMLKKDKQNKNKTREYHKIRGERDKHTVSMTSEYIAILEKLANELRIPRGQVIENLIKDFK